MKPAEITLQIKGSIAKVYIKDDGSLTTFLGLLMKLKKEFKDFDYNIDSPLEHTSIHVEEPRSERDLVKMLLEKEKKDWEEFCKD